MHLNSHTIRRWAKRHGWEPGQRGLLSDMVHDETHCCECCGERFTDRSDLDEGFCDDCADLPEGDAGIRKEFGTW